MIFLFLFTASSIFAAYSPAMAQDTAADQSNSKEDKSAEQSEPKKVKPLGPADEFNRGVPRSSLKGYLKAARDGDFDRAAKYLDLRYLPGRMDQSQGPQLARQLKIVLDKVIWFDLDAVSADPDGFPDDGLPANRDNIGRIKTQDKTADLLMQRVPRGDGVLIWKISNQTVAEIPHLYEYYGYGPFEESLSKIFPDAQFLGWQLWQWVLWLLNLVLAFVLAFIITWIVFIKRMNTQDEDLLLKDIALSSLYIILPFVFFIWIFN